MVRFLKRTVSAKPISNSATSNGAGDFIQNRSATIKNANGFSVNGKKRPLCLRITNLLLYTV